jgi:hypothetical protein
MTHEPLHPHLTPEEIELWAQGLLGAAGALHLAECRDCFAQAERERTLVRDLVRLPRFGPEFGFIERVMAHVRVPTPSGDFRA